eukprot:14998956-Ditylum_brightwellii.AAC.1
MDTADVIQLLTTDNTLYLAMDRSTALGIGYFGWVNAKNWIHICDNSTTVMRLQWYNICNLLAPSTTTQPNYD